MGDNLRLLMTLPASFQGRHATGPITGQDGSLRLIVWWPPLDRPDEVTLSPPFSRHAARALPDSLARIVENEIES